jgi:hypothetical protein
MNKARRRKMTVNAIDHREYRAFDVSVNPRALRDGAAAPCLHRFLPVTHFRYFSDRD